MVGSADCWVVVPPDSELDDSVQREVELVKLEPPGPVQTEEVIVADVVVVVVAVLPVGLEPVSWVPGEPPEEVAVVVVTVEAADVVDVGGPDGGLLTDVCDWVVVVPVGADGEGSRPVEVVLTIVVREFEVPA